MIEIIQHGKPNVIIVQDSESDMYIIQEEGKKDLLISHENLLKSFRPK